MDMKNKKSALTRITAMLLAVMLIAALGACSPKGPVIAVNVKIIDTTEVISKTVEVNEGASAGDAVKKACQADKTPYTVKDGMYDNFNDKASTMEYGWILYINGEVAQVGADQYKVKAGDELAFRYVNYAETYFSETVSVKIIDEETLFSDTVAIKEGDSAGDVISEACRKNMVVFSMKDGTHDRFDDHASTAEEGWVLYINGEASQVAANEYKVKAGDVIEFRYVNYEEVYFGE